MHPLTRHSRGALCFSGGKDSLAAYLLLKGMGLLPRVTVYHLDAGDLLPEVREIVARVEADAPFFVRVRTDARAWQAANGLPSDLVPYGQHGIGRMVGEGRQAIVHRYDCCAANLMVPLYDRIRADGHTLSIRGTKRADMRRLPAADGDVVDGLEIWLPLQEWSHADVFAYLRDQGAPECRLYEHVTNAPECARCPAWWGEKRAAYLRQFHPDLFEDYRAGLAAVLNEIGPSIEHLAAEVRGSV